MAAAAGAFQGIRPRLQGEALHRLAPPFIRTKLDQLEPIEEVAQLSLGL
jgi:hypothetical protein